MWPEWFKRILHTWMCSQFNECLRSKPMNVCKPRHECGLSEFDECVLPAWWLCLIKILWVCLLLPRDECIQTRMDGIEFEGVTIHKFKQAQRCFSPRSWHTLKSHAINELYKFQFLKLNSMLCHLNLVGTFVHHASFVFTVSYKENVLASFVFTVLYEENVIVEQSRCPCSMFIASHIYVCQPHGKRHPW